MSRHAEWAFTIEIYRKWAILGTEGARRMMRLHRDRFPNQTKIFDQVDAEVARS